MLRQLITFLLLAPSAVIAFVSSPKVTGQRSSELYALKKSFPAQSHIKDVELTVSVIMQSYYQTLNDQELTMEVIRDRWEKEGTLLEVEDEANVAVVASY